MMKRRNALCLIAGFIAGAIPCLVSLLSLRRAKGATLPTTPTDETRDGQHRRMVALSRISTYNALLREVKKFRETYGWGRTITIYGLDGPVNAVGEAVHRQLTENCELFVGQSKWEVINTSLRNFNVILFSHGTQAIGLDETAVEFTMPVDVDNRLMFDWDKGLNHMTVTIGARTVVMRNNIAAMHFSRHVLGQTQEQAQRVLGHCSAVLKFNLHDKQHLISFAHIPDVFVLTEAERDQWAFFAQGVYERPSLVRDALLSDRHLLPAAMRMKDAYRNA